VHVDRARIWTLPDEQPLLIGAAVSPKTAAAHADWADGLATVNQPADVLRDVVAAYRDAGGRGDASLQVHVCWDPDQERAERIAHDQWRSNVLGPPASWDIDSATVFDQVSAHVSVDAVKEAVLVEADLGRLTERLRDLVAIGFDRVYVHHVGQEQLPFLDAFGEHVLPGLKAA
jgi:alkanesulfonate monooxygenase SsuD/methylene tetrahydromethanopterin reductase-like flavin-dependent oxidoreductase (luciferase family)